MSDFGGASSVEIAAPADACFAMVCDTERTPDWHKAVSAVEVLERSDEGRSSLVRTSIDALVARVTVDLRFTYEFPHRIHMERESGDLKKVTVDWIFEDLGDGRTNASFATEFDPGRVLSLLAKGPIVGRLETLLAVQPPEGLKEALEAG